MFPNLRLIIGAAIATIALVIVMGSGVLSFRDPYRSLGDVPDVRRPFVEHSIVANPELPQFRLLAYARRSDELQRLLDLPAGPVQADAPEQATAFTFKVLAPADDSSPSDGPAAEAASPPGTQTGAPSEVSRAASLAAMPEETTEPPVATSPSDAAAASEETGSIPASSVPAIEHPPLPTANPREAHNRIEADGAAARPAKSRTFRARPRRSIRAVRILPRPVNRTPASVFGARPDQTIPSDIELFNQRPYNIQ